MPRRVGDGAGKRHPCRLGEGEGLAGRVRGSDRALERGLRAAPGGARGEPIEIDLAAGGMEVEVTVRELRDLREPAADREARHRVVANVLEEPAREVAHVEHRLDGKAVQAPHRLLGRAAGTAGDVGEAHRSRHVHPPVDGMDPRRARVRDDDPGGAEDREPSDNAEARVPRLLGEALAVPHPDLDDHVPGRAVRGRHVRDRLAHHPPRRRVDRGLADGHGEPGPGHRPDPRPRPELDAGTGGTLAHRGVDERKVGHVRVVARVLDDSGAGVPRPKLLRRKRERGPAPPRQLDGDRVRELSRHERRVCRAGRGGGAGAGRPAAAQALSLGRRHAAIPARMFHRSSAAAADPLAVTGRTLSSRFTSASALASTTPSASAKRSFGPFTLSPRRLDESRWNGPISIRLSYPRWRPPRCRARNLRAFRV